MSDGKRRVCLGAFAGAHGVKGDLKIKTFTEAEENVAAYGAVESEDGARRFHLRVVSVLKPGLALARATEVRTREEAEALAGVRFYVDRGALPPAEDGEYYVEDLIGLTATGEDGAKIGAVTAVQDFGAGPILEISLSGGGKGAIFIPFSDRAIPVVDLAGRCITITNAALTAAKSGAGGRAPS